MKPIRKTLSDPWNKRIKMTPVGFPSANARCTGQSAPCGTELQQSHNAGLKDASRIIYPLTEGNPAGQTGSFSGSQTCLVLLLHKKTESEEISHTPGEVLCETPANFQNGFFLNTVSRASPGPAASTLKREIRRNHVLSPCSLNAMASG